MPDTTDRSGLHLFLRVQKGEHTRGVVGHGNVGEALHRAPNDHRHGFVTPRNVEAKRSQPVVKIRQEAEIAVLRDASRLVAELLADPRRVHVKNDRRKLSRLIRTHGEARLTSVFRSHDDIVFDHRIALAGLAPHSSRDAVQLSKIVLTNRAGDAPP